MDEPATGTAKQRRALHKLGFRRASEGCWTWSPSAGDLPQPPPELPAFMAPAWTRVERTRAVDRARLDMVVQVLREVYGCTPERLVLTIVNDDEDDWEEDEDDDAFPALDCAALEARFGRLRRAVE